MAAMSRLALLQLLFVAANIRLAVFSKCDLIINEINTNSPQGEDFKEFIELKWDCPDEPTKLVDFVTVIIWHGGKHKEEDARAKDIFVLKTMFFSPKKPYFVLTTKAFIAQNNWTGDGFADVSEVVISGMFKDEWTKYLDPPKKGTEPRNAPEFLNNGKKRAIAISVYKGIVDVKFDASLSAETAHTDQLYDVVIYHENGPGEALFKHLFVKNSTGVLDPARRLILKEMVKSGTEDASMSYCCPAIYPMWPLAFKKSKLTPGEPNDCSEMKFLLHGEKGEISRKSVRCNQREAETVVMENNLAFSKEIIEKKSADKAADLGQDVKSGVGDSIVNGVKDATSSALGEAIQAEIESNGRQVTVLAIAIGSLVTVTSMAGLTFGYCYCKRRRIRRHRRRPLINEINSHNHQAELTDGSDMEDVMFNRERGFQTDNVL